MDGLCGTRDRVVLMTKCGHGNCELPAENFEEMVTEEFEKSLQLLQTDHVDLYMLHRDNLVVPVGEDHRSFESRNRQRPRPDSRASNWTCSRVDEANAYARQHGLAGFAAVSNNLSLAVQAQPFYKGLVDVDRAAEHWHQKTGIPLIVWSPQARGFFTGRYRPKWRIGMKVPKTTSIEEWAKSIARSENFERLHRARELGSRKGGYSAIQVALAWLLHKPFALVPIVGAHTPEELLSSIHALSLKLKETEVQWLNLENSNACKVICARAIM